MVPPSGFFKEAEPGTGRNVDLAWKRHGAGSPRRMVKIIVQVHKTASAFLFEVPLVVALIVIFIAAYAAIALEHPLGISKSASALFGAGLLWTVYALSIGDHA